MNSLSKVTRSIAIVGLICCVSAVTIAQSSYKESFKVGDDVLVSINTSHTNVVFETWNKNMVEVEAFIDDSSLSKTEKEEIFENWDLDVLGNSKKVVITSNEGSLWGGVESMGNLKALHRLNNNVALKSLESLKGLEGLNALKDLGNINFSMDNINVPDLEKFPIWPFNGSRPNLKNGDEYSHYMDRNKKSYTFDRGEYKKNKQRYVKELNDKYDSNVSVNQVDNWLDEVDHWSDNVEKVMEKWGEEFGEKFGKEMEAWGEEFGEKIGREMEAWGEEFGEQFGKEMEAWGEEFGKEMEKYGEQIEKDAEKWAEKLEKDGHNYSKKVTKDKNGNKSVLIQSDGTGLFHDGAVKAKKTIIIRLPKGAKTDINVRHGEVKMADASNIKANLNYAKLTANSIDGGGTLINAAYAPVYVNHWGNGMLDLKYVDDCKLNRVDRINLQANSSNVNINELNTEAYLSGSFGSLFVNKIADNFETIDIVLENTDATLILPKSAFTFYYNGKKSRFAQPASIEITTRNKSDSRSLLKGFYKTKDSGRSLTINASYSNISLQN